MGTLFTSGKLRSNSRLCDSGLRWDFLGNATFGSLTRIGSKYRGWVVEKGKVRQLQTSTDAAQLDNLTGIFESLCSRPDSRERDLRSVGNCPPPRAVFDSSLSISSSVLCSSAHFDSQFDRLTA